MDRNISESSRGAAAAVACYLTWGLVPLFWKHLAAISAVELIAHRNIWSLVLVATVVLIQGGFPALRAALGTPRTLAITFGSASLLTGNWLVYVWGVNTGHVIEASLGYFLVPMVNVASGRLMLREHLRRAQWIAIACAAVGVTVLIVQVGRPPWIALTLAATWGGYSLMRKKSTLGTLTGLAAEMVVLSPFALAYLSWRYWKGMAALGHVDATHTVLLLGTGVITAVPLLLFAYGAKRIRLSTLGLLQYLTPTAQFVLGVWFYHEPFPRARLLSFAFIWAGLALYVTDSILAQRKQQPI